MIATLIVIGVIIGISLLPIGVQASYDVNGALLQFRVGPLLLKLYPRDKKLQEESRRRSKGNAGTSATERNAKSGGSLNELLPILRVVRDLLRDFKRKLTIERLEFKLVLAGDDPCDLSVNYGRAWAALGNLMPKLENHFDIRKRNLEVECDYLVEKTTIFLLVDLRMTLGRLLNLAVRHGFRGLIEYRKLLKIRKGGA